MIQLKKKYVLLSVFLLALFIPFAFIFLFFIGTMDTDDLFSPSEDHQIAKWNGWCEDDIRNYSSISEVTNFLKEKGFYQIIRPAYTRSVRKFFEIYEYIDHGRTHRYINEYKNETNVFIKVSDRNVRNWEGFTRMYLDKTLVITIQYSKGKITKCDPIVNRHGR